MVPWSAASESEDGEDDHDADEEESDEELGDMDEEALLQEIVALRGQMGDEVDEEDDDDVREGGERGMGRASTSGVQFQQQSDDDSSEDERENRNTVGNVPLKQWYKDEEHIGYDRDGNKLMKARAPPCVHASEHRSGGSSGEWRVR